METKFQILEQTSPTRCEICHQADLFDPLTASCLRCQALILTQTLPEEEAERYRRRQEAGLTQRALAARLKRPLNVVSRIEQGQRRVDLLEWIALCPEGVVALF